MYYGHKVKVQEAAYVESRQKSREAKHQVKNLQRIVSTAVILLCVGFLVLGGVSLASANNFAYVLSVNDEEIAVLASKTEAETVLERYLDEKEHELGVAVAYGDSVEIKKVPADEVVYSSVTDAANALDGNIFIKAQAYAMLIDDSSEPIYVRDKDVARDAIDTVKDYYTNEDETVLDVAVVEEVTGFEALAGLDEVYDANEAANILLYGKPELDYYFVADVDETMASVAEKTGVNADVIKKMNPSITDDTLQVGTAVCLTEVNPLLTVQITKEVKEIQEIPFETEEIDNSTLARGTENVVTEGVNGEQEVTLKVVELNGVRVSSETVGDPVVLVEPTNEVVERGTKMVLASRDYGGSGMLAWPYNGTITSRYGYRSFGWHSGLDIAGPTGSPIVAAESGTVFFAGWSGAYGYLVKIDHGDGLVTYYAHCSEMYVSAGSTVAKNDVIAAIGSTGNSTGPHVHFEVRFDGITYDPLNYL